MTTLIIATRNVHKVGEIRAILGARFEYHSLNEVSHVPEVVEDAGSFAGNATKKAVELARWLAATPSVGQMFGSRKDMNILADDSGLEVEALGWAPGVHSARFAALDSGLTGNSSTADNNAKLLRLLTNVPREQRKARFRCVLALTPVLNSSTRAASPVCSADEFEFQTQTFEGVCEGWIGFEPRGVGGFGYDPLFFPRGYDRTFGELSESVKNELSHRARALALLQTTLAKRESPA